MKIASSSLLLTTILFFSLNNPLIAQEENTEKQDKNSISVDLFRGLTRDADIYQWMIQYERAINNKFSVVAAYEFGQYEHYSKTTTPVSPNPGATSTDEEYKVGGNMLLIEGRYYPLNKNRIAPRGFFVGTYFKHFWLEEEFVIDDQNEFTKSQTIKAFGADIGYQFFNDWFMIEPVLGFGGGTNSGVGDDERIDSQMASFELTNYSLRFAVNIGVCF